MCAPARDGRHAKRDSRALFRRRGLTGRPCSSVPRHPQGKNSRGSGPGAAFDCEEPRAERDAGGAPGRGLPWAAYELNKALKIALCGETCEGSWMAGVDVFVSALTADVSLKEMAKTFGAIKAMPV